MTAVEVAEATGLTLSVVHRAIDSLRIPGKKVPVSERYSHRYVDIAAYIRAGTFADTKTIRENLDRLLAAVKAAKTDASTVSKPRVPSTT